MNPSPFLGKRKTFYSIPARIWDRPLVPFERSFSDDVPEVWRFFCSLQIELVRAWLGFLSPCVRGLLRSTYKPSRFNHSSLTGSVPSDPCVVADGRRSLFFAVLPRQPLRLLARLSCTTFHQTRRIRLCPCPFPEGETATTVWLPSTFFFLVLVFLCRIVSPSRSDAMRRLGLLPLK